MRFVGQRVVAVLADTIGAAEAGCRQVVVEYDLLPAVFDPEEAMTDGAPQLHGSADPFVQDKSATSCSNYTRCIRDGVVPPPWNPASNGANLANSAVNLPWAESLPS